MSQMGASRLLYDGAQAIGEYNAAGTLTRRHIPGAGLDEVVVTYNDATLTHRRWAMTDERGSVVALTGATAAGLNINTYDEYGQPGSGNTGLYQYTGQIWLPQAQAYHYKARVYAPQLGRFMQTDPIGYGDGANLYAYVSADPMNAIDPLGLSDVPGDTWKCWPGQDCNPTTDMGDLLAGGSGGLRRPVNRLDSGNGARPTRRRNPGQDLDASDTCPEGYLQAEVMLSGGAFGGPIGQFFGLGVRMSTPARNMGLPGRGFQTSVFVNNTRLWGAGLFVGSGLSAGAQHSTSALGPDGSTSVSSIAAGEIAVGRSGGGSVTWGEGSRGLSYSIPKIGTGAGAYFGLGQAKETRSSAAQRLGFPAMGSADTIWRTWGDGRCS
ncbi:MULTISPECIES: RHS repeat-associated core domain-containing protein, partial [unclassified Brevundimonas]